MKLKTSPNDKIKIIEINNLAKIILCTELKQMIKNIE